MAKKLMFSYDKEGDLLDISLGKPREAISREVEDDFFIRFDPMTEEIVGFSILNFEKWFEKKEQRTVPLVGEFFPLEEFKKPMAVAEKKVAYRKK